MSWSLDPDFGVISALRMLTNMSLIEMSPSDMAGCLSILQGEHFKTRQYIIMTPYLPLHTIFWISFHSQLLLCNDGYEPVIDT